MGGRPSSWSVQATPAPGPDDSRTLEGVSCPATTACSAVGSAFTGATSTFAPLAEAWDGATWTVQATQPASSNFLQLAGVSCSAATACTAVGNDLGAPLVERLCGSSWSIQSTPVTRPLFGVACVTATTCVAAGGSAAPGGS